MPTYYINPEFGYKNDDCDFTILDCDSDVIEAKNVSEAKKKAVRN